MIDLEIYKPGEAIPATKIITLEGTARAGKGTCGGALVDALEADGRSVATIDQGQKFRVLGYLGMEQGVDLENDYQAQTFLEAGTTRTAMLGLLGKVAAMPETDRKNLLYTSQIGVASKEVGRQEIAQNLAFTLLFDQVAEASEQKVDTVLVDGRALETEAFRMYHDKLGLYVVGFYFQCDSLTAARRSLKEFRPLAQLTTEERLALLAETDNLAERNDADARRASHPMRYPHGAYDLDMLRGLSADPDERAVELEQIVDTGIVSAHTTHVTIPQMVAPVVEVSRYALDRADDMRADWQRRGGIPLSAFERVPETV